MQHLLNRFFLLSVIGTIILFFSCSPTDNTDCEKFKNGNFVFKLHRQPGVVTYITRQDSIQTETDKQTGYFSKLRIRWTDKCKYELLLLETTFPFPDSIQNIRKTIPLKTEIISCSKDYYVFKSQRGNSLVMTDTLWVEK